MELVLPIRSGKRQGAAQSLDLLASYALIMYQSKDGLYRVG
jgi:hypothetical protein